MEMELKQAEAAIEDGAVYNRENRWRYQNLPLPLDHDEDTTRKIVHNMMDKYEAEDRGIKIIELENAFQLCTKQEYIENLIKVASQPRKLCIVRCAFGKRSRLSLINSPLPKMEIEKNPWCEQ